MFMAEQYEALEKTLDELRTLGLEVDVLQARNWRIRGRAFGIIPRGSTPSPALLTKQSHNRVLWSIPTLTPGLRKLAESNRLIALVGHETGEVWLEGELLKGARSIEIKKRPRGRVPWARFGLMRALAQSREPRTQVALAQLLGVTQARISVALRELGDLVIDTGQGWRARDFDAISQAFLSTYPGPGGIRLGWYSRKPIIEQGKVLVGLDPTVVLSADSAADILAPYRTPKVSLAYVQQSLTLEEHGFAGSSIEEATLLEVRPEDPTVFALATSTGSGKVVDGLLLAHDLRVAAGVDADQAVAHLLLELRRGWE